MTLFCFAISTTSSLNVFVEFIYKQTSWSFSSRTSATLTSAVHTQVFSGLWSPRVHILRWDRFPSKIISPGAAKWNVKTNYPRCSSEWSLSIAVCASKIIARRRQPCTLLIHAYFGSQQHKFACAILFGPVSLIMGNWLHKREDPRANIRNIMWNYIM